MEIAADSEIFMSTFFIFIFINFRLENGELESTREIDFSHSFLVSSHFASIDCETVNKKMGKNSHLIIMLIVGAKIEMYSQKNISSELFLMRNIASFLSIAASSRSFN